MVVFLWWWCGAVFMVVVWWCFCGGVLVFLWWSFVVVFLRWCAGFYGSLLWCFCGGGWCFVFVASLVLSSWRPSFLHVPLLHLLLN